MTHTLTYQPRDYRIVGTATDPETGAISRWMLDAENPVARAMLQSMRAAEQQLMQVRKERERGYFATLTGSLSEESADIGALSDAKESEREK